MSDKDLSSMFDDEEGAGLGSLFDEEPESALVDMFDDEPASSLADLFDEEPETDDVIAEEGQAAPGSLFAPAPRSAKDIPTSKTKAPRKKPRVRAVADDSVKAPDSVTDEELMAVFSAVPPVNSELPVEPPTEEVAAVQDPESDLVEPSSDDAELEVASADEDTAPKDASTSPVSDIEPAAAKPAKSVTGRIEEFFENADAARQEFEVEPVEETVVESARPTASDGVWDPFDGPKTIGLVDPAQAERLQPFVQRVLGRLNSGDTRASISKRVGEFILTRDHELDAKQRADLEEMLSPYFSEILPEAVDKETLTTILDLVYDELLGLGPLGPLWRDDDITEILVDDFNHIYVERNGVLLSTKVAYASMDRAKLFAKDLVTRIAHRALDNKNALVSADLSGARINVAFGPVTDTGLAISVRKMRPLVRLDALQRYGTFSDEMMEFFREIVLAKANIVVSGSTGAGKTTVISALSEFIPHSQRVVTIEDTRELSLLIPFWKALQSREKASSDDESMITVKQLLENVLRMRPDRIIVGEVREGQAAAAMIRAASTGHDGTMTTVHANSAEDAIEQLSLLLSEGTGASDEVSRRRVMRAFDVAVQVSRGHGGKRYISEVAVIDSSARRRGGDEVTLLFEGVQRAGEIVFNKVGRLDLDSALAQKMRYEDLDPGKWA